MRELDVKVITENIKEMCIEATHFLTEDMKNVLDDSVTKEESPLGKQILQQLQENLKIAGDEMIPICQDTGMAVVFIKVGQDVHFTGGNIEDAINEGVRQGYTEGYLRKSVVKDPIIRENTKDNTPAIIHYSIVEGNDVEITVAPKGFGSENMSRIFMLKPAEGKDAGEYAITGTSSNTNYSVTFVNGTYTITRINPVKELLDWTIEDKTYNKEAQGVTVKAKEGVEGLGEITVRYNGQEEIPQEAGTYEVTVDVAEGTNYKEETGIRLGSYTIKPAEVTVTIDNKTSVYGEDLKELTSNVTEGTVIEGDDLGIALTKAEGTTVGEYAITGTASNTNYDVSFVDGKYTITTRAAAATIYKEAKLQQKHTPQKNQSA